MAKSDAILMRLLELHPKIIDLSLARMEKILAKLGHPEKNLPPIIHIAGTNGKGSTQAFCRSILEAAGLKVHCYTSPHLVKFHERIRIAGHLITDAELSALLEECEKVNVGEPITFFEITTAAAFLAFSRNPADYLILEVGLGGRLDATNVIENSAVSIITSIGLDHQQYLGDTIEEIAAEKAGILKKNGTAIIAPQSPEVRAVLEQKAEALRCKASIANQDWQSYLQHGRLVFQDERGLLDLPLPNLLGPHQIDNVGNAIAALRALGDERISDEAIERGITTTEWPARMQALKDGALNQYFQNAHELWLDGGHNAPAGEEIAKTLNAMQSKNPKDLYVIWGMINTKHPMAFIQHLKNLPRQLFTVTIPEEVNAIPAVQLAESANAIGIAAEPAENFEAALAKIAKLSNNPRILICGSLYLAGHVLAAHAGEEMSKVSGAAKR